MFAIGHVIEGAGTDYAYRTFLTRDDVANAMVRMVAGIDSKGLKNSVTDKRRVPYLFQIWDIMYQMQEDFAQSPPVKWKPQKPIKQTAARSINPRLFGPSAVWP
jgi:hypothetical protein